MSTLYELNGQLMELLMMAEDPEIDEEALQGSIEAVEGEIEDKLIAYAKIIRQLEADQAGVKNEKKRLSRIDTTIDNSISRMKKAAQTSMELCGKDKIKTGLFNFNIQPNPESVVIDVEDVYKIPDEYLSYKKPEPNKTEIKKAIKEGKTFDFAHLEKTKSLRIR